MVKVALIGAGSATFAQEVITDILAIQGLDEDTFALVDLDTERLELTHEVAEYLPYFRKSQDMLEPYIRMLDEMASAQKAYLPRFINSE
jgi:alpha-galactosidase/6-phospho-beta-glucosidase family protein